MLRKDGQAAALGRDRRAKPKEKQDFVVTEHFAMDGLLMARRQLRRFPGWREYVMNYAGRVSARDAARVTGPAIEDE